MKSKIAAVLTATLLSAGGLTAAAHAQTPQRPTVNPPPQGAYIELFDGRNFSGQSVRLTGDESNLNRRGFNDRASSLRVYGAWEVCYHANYGGQCQVFDRDAGSLGGLDNQVSSVRQVYTSGPGGGGGGGGGGAGANTPRDGVRLFDGRNYSGQRYDVQSDTYDLNRTGFNDRTESIAIARGETWEFCMDSNFRSQCRTFSESIPDLGAYGFDNTISSMRRVGGGYPGGPGRPGGPGGPGFGGPGGAFVNITGETRGENGVGFFSVPRVNGSAIDHCEYGGGRTCGDSGADRICEAAGYGEAVYYSIEPPRRYGGTTVHISSGQQCRGRDCGAVVNLLCTSR